MSGCNTSLHHAFSSRLPYLQSRAFRNIFLTAFHNVVNSSVVRESLWSKSAGLMAWCPTSVSCSIVCYTHQYLGQIFEIRNTFRPIGIKAKSIPSASRSPRVPTCFGGASFRPLRLSVNTGGHALLSRMGVSLVGLEVRLIAEIRLTGGVKVFLLFKANISLPTCDALCSG